jgi:hypothetical protein
MSRIILRFILIFLLSLFIAQCGGISGGEPAPFIDDGLSSDFFIKELTFSSGTLRYPFNPDDWSNYLEVPYETDSITVKATPKDIWTKLYIGDKELIPGVDSEPISLKPGENIIKIVAISESGEELTYVIYVIRCSQNYSIASLSELAIDGIALNPAFEISGKNRDFFAVTDNERITLHATPTAQSEGASIDVKVNDDTVSSLSEISLNPGINTIAITSIAPDKKTKLIYTLTVIRQVDSSSSKLAYLKIAGGAFDKEFNPDETTYSINVTSTMNPVNLCAIAQARGANVSVKLNDELVSDTSSIRLRPGALSVITIVVTKGSSSTTYKINAQSLQGSDNANLSSLKLMVGTKSFRPLYQGTFNRSVNYHNPDNTIFDKNITEYCSVIYGFDSVTATATAEDNTVKAIQFVVDGETIQSDLEGGIATSVIPLQPGLVKKLEIVVIAGDETTRKTYSVYIKLLNLDEFYWGVYAPSLDKSKAERWEPKPGAGGSKTVNGNVSGTMRWSITFSPTSTIVLANYNDGKFGFKYNDGGFIAHGTQEAALDGVVSKNGYNVTKPGTVFYLKTAEGEEVAQIGYHIKVQGGDTVEGVDSWVDFTYLGQTVRKPYKLSKPYPFSDSYDWYASWDDGF